MSRGQPAASTVSWMTIILGVVTAIIGLLLLINVGAAVATLVWLAAFGLVFGGVGDLIRGSSEDPAWPSLVIGVVEIVAGVIALAWPGMTLFALAIVVGIGFIAAGGTRLYVAMSGEVPQKTLQIIWGALSIVAGIIAVVWPGVTVLALAILLGIRLFLTGLLEVAWGVDAKNALT